ncbi:hypothetical protein LJK87_29860 [Paenibacillus sp. P25]|nr:hypothetical protein LJK87_29860 [Paenibacillus sp. P25]
MVGKFIRENRYAAGSLTVVRVLLGWKWMTSGWGKLTGSAPFQADDYLKKAIEGSVGDKATVQGWWGIFCTTSLCRTFMYSISLSPGANF